MAGKSTVMRNLCAVSLLAACGFHAPVASAVVPYTDAHMLRTFSADSPVEGKSSFASEMSEMKYASQPHNQPDNQLTRMHLFGVLSISAYLLLQTSSVVLCCLAVSANVL